ncbi:hypothetical protein [Pseudomonas sp. BF-R-01]|nr:hypothetical protein [Pseudomonas sp. BF-R-01]
MFRLPVVETILLGALHAFFVGAKLAREGNLEDAIAGKPAPTGTAFFME